MDKQEIETYVNPQKFIEKTDEAILITCSGDIADEGYCEASHQFLFNSNI